MKQPAMSQSMKRIFLLALAAGMLLLTACTNVRIIESQVQSTPQWTGSAPSKAFYRWDRLPADVNNPQAGWAEVQLESALAPLGWTRNDLEAQYTVWVGVRTAEFIADPWGRPVRSPWVNHLHISVGSGYRAHGMGVGFGMSTGLPPFGRAGFPPPSGYAQEVSIIVRDLNTSNVVYQTKATHEGPWADHANILPSMMAAALQGFPNPQVRNRRVDTPISR
jgi:hypothetical protein